MNKLLFSATSLLLIAFASSAQATLAQPSQDPAKTTVTFDKVYVPNGFDANDHVQIVGSGMFSSSCYRPAETKLTIDEDKQIIHLAPVAYRYPGLCLQVTLPFEQVVEVGILKAGTWTIEQGSDHQRMGQIVIKPNLTNMPDDYMYAPISQAFFVQKGMTGEIWLNGEFRTSCLAFDHVKVEIENSVIVVQPITKLTFNGSCVSGSYSFMKMVPVDFVLPGRYLLHVRSMNSHAVNSLIDVK